METTRRNRGILIDRDRRRPDKIARANSGSALPTMNFHGAERERDGCRRHRAFGSRRNGSFVGSGSDVQT